MEAVGGLGLAKIKDTYTEVQLTAVGKTLRALCKKECGEPESGRWAT